MKKILAVMIVAVLAVALCVGANAASLKNHSFDTIYVNDLDNPAVNDGQAKAWSEANPIDAEVEKIRVRGWAHLEGSTIAAFGYKVDDGEAVVDAGFIFDRPDVQGAFGVTADVANGFDITLDLANAGKGEHTVTLLVKAADGDLVEITSFKFTQQKEAAKTDDPAPEKSADQWLGGSEPAGHSTGWWMNPIAEGCDKYIKIGFTAAGNFSGIHGYYLCNPAAAEVGPTVVKAQILKGDTVLAEKEIPVDGDAWYDTDFGKTIPAGDYTLAFLPVSGNGGWFVLGSYDGQGEWTIDTNCATNSDTKTHPEIMLVGAAAADPQPSNPGTADASVIAIAAVACVALAGVVVAKKIR